MKTSSLPKSLPEVCSGGVSAENLALMLARWERENGAKLEDVDLCEQYSSFMPKLRDTLSYARQFAAVAESGRPANSPCPSTERTTVGDRGPSVPGYEIIETIDYGGQGLIYKAVQLATDQVVALKLLLDGPLSSERQRRRFNREVEIISRLSHPNIVPLVDNGEANGRQYFAMEYVDGLPIDGHFLLNLCTLDVLVSTVEKVCRAVASAHQLGVIHRDLKPANILVDRQGDPHILDFGLAKELGEESEDRSQSRLSCAGQILGTLPYLSPEQAEGVSQIDVRSDIYSLGVILYELVTGVPPYDTGGDPEVARRTIRFVEPLGISHTRKRAPGLPLASATSVPNDLERVILKALAKDKTRRYQSATELADDLGRFHRCEAVLAKADSPYYVLRKALQRNRVPVLIAAAFLVLLVGWGITGALLWQHAERQAEIYQKGLERGAYLRLAMAKRDKGRVDEALEMLQAGTALGIDSSVQDPASFALAFRLEYELTALSFEVGRIGEAQVHAQKARALVDEQIHRFPGDAEWQRFLALTTRNEGLIALVQRQTESAVRQFKQGATILERLYQADPENNLFLGDLAAVYQTLAEGTRRLNQEDESHEYCLRSVSAYRRLYQAEPRSGERATALAKGELSLVGWRMNHKTDDQDNAAVELLDEIKSQLDQLEKANPQHGLNRDVDRIRGAIMHNRDIIDRRRPNQTVAPTGPRA